MVSCWGTFCSCRHWTALFEIREIEALGYKTALAVIRLPDGASKKTLVIWRVACAFTWGPTVLTVAGSVEVGNDVASMCWQRHSLGTELYGAVWSTSYIY